ncbi:MAG: response regulator transcription factor [Proteobacteria bacterium]|nr:response regulator transcription factor [Pseudomonadota bacterium]
MRLLLIEDDRPLAEGLSETLRLGGYAVDWVDTGTAGDTALLTGSFDGVILDLNLPGRDGFGVLQRLRTRGDFTPVLVLSARDETTDRVRGLDLGADDYLTKPFEVVELEARLRAMLRRSKGAAANEMVIGPLRLDATARRATLGDEPLELTAREFGILELLAMRRGQVVSKTRLANSLSDWTQDLTANALDILIHRLRKKLEGSQVEIRTLRGFGYLLDESHGD